MTSPAHAFLAALWGDTPPGLIQVWRKPDKLSFYLKSPAGVDGFVNADSQDVYVGVGTTEKSLGKNRRAAAGQVNAIAGLWLDVDVNGGPTEKKGAAPSKNEARRVLEAHAAPTLIVDSGYGLQGWWVFEEPMLIRDAEERLKAAHLAGAWVRLHAAAAWGMGWPSAVDAVQDLSRVMRIPGTWNAKGAPVAVSALQMDGPRHPLATLLGIAGDAPRPAQAPLSGDRPAVEVRPGMVPLKRLEALRANLEDFEASWTRSKDQPSWSASEWDLSVATLAAGAGWTDQELADLIVAYRDMHGEDAEKGQRVDYLERTIQRARIVGRAQTREEMREDAMTDLTLAAEGGAPPATAHVMAAFNLAVACGLEAAPRFRDCIQYRGTGESRYVLVTEEGREVNVGPGTNLIDWRRFSTRLMDETLFVMPGPLKDAQWRMAVTALLRCAEVREEPEAPVIEWVRQYLRDRTMDDRDEACRNRYPFRTLEGVHLYLEHFSTFVTTTIRQRVTRNELRPLLESAGFRRVTIHHTVEGGGRSSASYYQASPELLG